MQKTTECDYWNMSGKKKKNIKSELGNNKNYHF